MRAVLRFLGSRWFLTFIGVALLARAGLAVRPVPVVPGRLDPRAIVIAVMVLIWAGRELLARSPAQEERGRSGQGRHRGPGRSHRRRVRRGSRGDAREADHRAGAAEEGIRLARLSLRAAVVRDHRPARRRQDHRAAERRPVVPARRRDGAERGRRRRRHAHVRLVVHRERGADRHRRPLHHAGFRRGGGQGGLAGLPRPAEAHPRPPAAERRAGRDRIVRYRRRTRRGTARACPRDPPPGQGTVRPAWRARAGLCAVHQGRPDRRLHRVLRRPRSRAARAGLGRHLPAEQDRGRHRRPVRRRVRHCWSSG